MCSTNNTIYAGNYMVKKKSNWNINKNTITQVEQSLQHSSDNWFQCSSLFYLLIFHNFEGSLNVFLTSRLWKVVSTFLNYVTYDLLLPGCPSVILCHLTLIFHSCHIERTNHFSKYMCMMLKFAVYILYHVTAQQQLYMYFFQLTTCISII